MNVCSLCTAGKGIDTCVEAGETKALSCDKEYVFVPGTNVNDKTGTC